MAIETFDDAVRWLKEGERELDKFLSVFNCEPEPSESSFYRSMCLDWQEIKKVIQIIEENEEEYMKGYDAGYDDGREGN